MFLEKCKVLENKKITDNKYLIKLSFKKLKKGNAGQFYMLQAFHQHAFLKRPISLHAIKNNTLEFYYETKGQGTVSIASLKKGDEVEVQGPLGNGFNLNVKNKNILVIGGGMGIAPMKELIGKLKQNNKVSFIASGRDKQALSILKNFDLKNVKVYKTTDDGSVGEKMNALTKLKQLIPNLKIDLIYCCGPHIMMEKIGLEAIKNKIECYLSLENRMACGMKACVGCSIQTKEGMKKVCGDGPVFNAEELLLEKEIEK